MHTKIIAPAAHVATAVTVHVGRAAWLDLTAVDFPAGSHDTVCDRALTIVLGPQVGDFCISSAELAQADHEIVQRQSHVHPAIVVAEIATRAR